MPRRELGCSGESAPMIASRQRFMMLLGFITIAASASAVSAQGVIVRGATTIRFLELRPYVDDSVASDAESSGNPNYRQLTDGRVIRCIVGDAYCRFKRAGDVANSMPITQDLQIRAWGLGRGISLHSDLRVRSAMGSQPALWPRAEDRFDVLSAYIELDRSRYTVKAGRQYAVSGLGVYNFDGATVVLRPARPLTVEVFGGWSLAQALNESITTSEIAAVDELPPDRNAYLVGAQARWRIDGRGALNGLYQREIRTNRSALYSERVSLDGLWQLQHLAFEGAFTKDLSADVTNEMRLRARSASLGQTALSLEIRRFRPFFELWTIWGAFAPVGFDEMRAQASWHTKGYALSFDVHGAKRAWQESDAGLDFAPLRADGWRIGGAALWRASSSIYTNAEYSADVGYGASRTEGDVGVHWDRGRVFVGATATAFQSIYEFRLGTSRVVGLGVDLGWRISPDSRIVTELTNYRQSSRNGEPSSDWNQRRATARFEWMVGRDPGARTVTAAARKAAARANDGGSRVATSRSPSAGLLPAMAGPPPSRP